MLLTDHRDPVRCVRESFLSQEDALGLVWKTSMLCMFASRRHLLASALFSTSSPPLPSVTFLPEDVSRRD